MAARVDRNRSTFSLEHDSRPQDLQPLQQGYQQPLTTDFRFKGYPSENFFKYKEPQYKRMSASYDQPETNRYFGKSQHFDTARPKVEDGPRGPPYGTGDPSMDDQQAARPGPMRGLGYDNSMEMERERNRREAEDADLDIIRARKQEELRQMERVEERRRDMEMLKNYNPWGRPGGGAPKTGSFDEKTDNRKQRFTEHQLTPRNNDLSYKDNWEPAFPDIENEFNRLSNKNGYNPSGPGDRTRYDGNGHDMQRKREELREQDHKLEQLKSELEYLKSSAREPEMGYPNQDSFAARNNVYGDQRGRAPESSRSSNIQHQIDEYDDVGRIGKPKKPNRFQPQIYYPFNKPGGGAPILDQHGKIMTSLQSRSELTDDQKRQEAIRAKLYHRDLDVQYQNEMRKKREDKEELSKPHGELAVLMDRGRVGKPRKNSRTGLLENHHLAQSDVVKLKIGEPQSDRGKQSQYNADLGYLVSEKNKKSELNKLKENQEGLKHLHTMDQTFGRLGGGAPKGYTLQKLNLDRIINHPTKEEASMEYVKSKDWSEVEPDKNPLNSWREDYDGRLSPRQKPGKYIRSTVTSNHANQYDYRYDYPKKDYTLDAPYATSGERARLM